MKKGAGVDRRTGGFNTWFHGIITRQESEDLLRNTPSGTFLVRVAESRFGYSLSHKYVVLLGLFCDPAVLCSRNANT